MLRRWKVEQLAPGSHLGNVRTLSLVLYTSYQNLNGIKFGVSFVADLPSDHLFSHAHLEQTKERQMQPRDLSKCAWRQSFKVWINTFEIFHTVKTWVFYSGEYVWFWVLLPLGFRETNELFINSFQVIMSGVSVFGNSFFLLATFYLAKHVEDSHGKKPRDSLSIRPINTIISSNKGTASEKDHQEVSDSFTVHNEKNLILTFAFRML